jgi:hypothetical protein
MHDQPRNRHEDGLFARGADEGADVIALRLGCF